MKKGEFGLASNPEFLKEGHAIEDTLKPDRLVIGTSDRRSKTTMVALYRRFYGRLPKTLHASPTNAELIKHASNSFLATKISFINELAKLVSRFPGGDISTTARGMGFDKRISPHSLRAGLGYGGSCLPKDVDSLIHEARKKGVKLAVVEAARDANRTQPLVALNLAEKLVGSVSGKKVALLGLAFKPESDDTREAVSIQLAKELVRRKAKVVAYDPVAIPNARKILKKKIAYAVSARDCLAGADCCVITTEWKEFGKLRPETFKRLMKTPAVVDGRRILEPDLFAESGVRFAAVGLGSQANQ